MADATVEELRELFLPIAKDKTLDDDTLAELQSIMRMHSLPAQELFYKWEGYCMKLGNNDLRLDGETVRALKQDVQDGLERESKKTVLARNTGKRAVASTPRGGPDAGAGNVFGMLDGLVPNTPRSAMSIARPSTTLKKKHVVSTPLVNRSSTGGAAGPNTPSQPGDANAVGKIVPFHERAHAGQAVEVLNDHLAAAEPPIAPYADTRIKLTAGSDVKKLAYKTMAMKTSEASEILDDRIDEFMHLVQEHHKLDDSIFGSAASQSISEVVSVGRIACDAPEGRLNASSLVLESSRRIGAGLRIPLDMGNLDYKFFPGQIVALRGLNASGDKFVVREILDMPLLGSASTAIATMEEHINRLHGGPDAMDTGDMPQPLNVMIASGPYTSDDNLDFEPLHALCSQAADTYADALILAGPFLDIDHPLIASGDIDLPEEAMIDPDIATMATVFRFLVSPALHQLVSAHPKIIIILVPSVKDAINPHTSWPQQPFPRQDLHLPKSVKIVGNPMSLALNEVVVGLSSQDILSELRHEETIGGKAKSEAMLARLPKYIIEQRHFFPLFPAMQRSSLPRTGTTEGVPAGSMLDTSYLKLGEILNARPDLLITPSALPPFARVVDSVVVVNPGYLAKRRGAGTYAKLSIYPIQLDDNDRGQSRIAHRLFDRARVDIIRI